MLQGLLTPAHATNRTTLMLPASALRPETPRETAIRSLRRPGLRKFGSAGTPAVRFEPVLKGDDWDVIAPVDIKGLVLAEACGDDRGVVSDRVRLLTLDGLDVRKATRALPPPHELNWRKAETCPIS